ncbi:MAG: peroxidase family protein [Chloroflexota bacterium]
MSHGKGFKIVAPRSKFYRGPFGRICPDLPAWAPELDLTPEELAEAGTVDTAVERKLLKFANDHMIEVTAPSKKPSEAIKDQKDRNIKDDSDIPAGYTYFGQFIDHDITFDPASSLMRQNDPSGLLNHRTPRLDLDNLYGGGPSASPHFYDKDEKFKFAIAKVTETVSDDPPRQFNGKTFEYDDLPRLVTKEPTAGDEAIAIIGDPRNDENVMVSQLHLAFLLAHNALYDRAIELTKKPKEELTDDDKAAAFERARTTLRWLYQYIVWNDFLRRISDRSIHKIALQLEELKFDEEDDNQEHEDGEKPPSLKFWKNGLDEIYKWKHQPFMPVEFSVAAYRFGHTLVRNSYRTNVIRGASDDNFVAIFDNSKGLSEEEKEENLPDDLRGQRIMKVKNVIQWDWFLDMESSTGAFPQNTRRFDTKLANALAFLHEKKLAPDDDIQEPSERKINFLAFRNLMRGYQFNLPSGTSIAKKYGLRTVNLDPKNDIDALWYYVLKEAEAQGKGNHLGKVGSAIVCATFAGLLLGDPNSYLNLDPCWHPKGDEMLSGHPNDIFENKEKLKTRKDLRVNAEDVNGNDVWTLATIIRLAGLPIKRKDIEDLEIIIIQAP